MEKKNTSSYSEPRCFKDYAINVTKLVGAGVITYICSSNRMREVYRIKLCGFKKEVAIALGLRKYTPELRKEMDIRGQVTELIESIDDNCITRTNYKNKLKFINNPNEKDKILVSINNINATISREKEQLKYLKSCLKKQSKITNNAQKVYKKQRYS